MWRERKNILTQYFLSIMKTYTEYSINWYSLLLIRNDSDIDIFSNVREEIQKKLYAKQIKIPSSHLLTTLFTNYSYLPQPVSTHLYTMHGKIV